MKWIKASERLPETENYVFIRNKDSKVGGMLLPIVLKTIDGLENVEWLDESESVGVGKSAEWREVPVSERLPKENGYYGCFRGADRENIFSYPFNIETGKWVDYDNTPNVTAWLEKLSPLPLQEQPERYDKKDMERCWNESRLSFAKEIGNDTKEEEEEFPIAKNFNEFIQTLRNTNHPKYLGDG